MFRKHSQVTYAHWSPIEIWHFGAIFTSVQISKMTARFEVFDKLRELGNTLDKTSSSLSSLNEPEQNSKARACLHLRETLAEVKSFKVSMFHCLSVECPNDEFTLRLHVVYYTLTVEKLKSIPV